MKLPKIIGHRGAAASAPENTLAGFARAAALGAGWVEFDVRLCGDGRPVVIHDATLERTTDGQGPVAGASFDQIRALDAGRWFAPGFAGERVPSLGEALRATARLGLGADVELKAEPGREEALAAAAVAAVQGARRPGRAPILVSSFNVPCLDRVGALAPEMPRAYPLPRAGLGAHLAVARRAGATFVDHRRLTRRRTERIRAAGLALIVYTVNDPARARTLWSWGIDSVITDAPDTLLAALS